MGLSVAPLQKVWKGIKHASKLQPKFQIDLTKSHYRVKTVTEAWEFQEVLRLRYLVFNKEFKKAKSPIGWDVDDYDFLADHLIIIDQTVAKKPKIVGTYRMILSTHSDRFYSENEFDLKKFLALPGIKLELGRACIHPLYRKGSVINLLWRGVSEYMKQSKADYLFGCSSARITDLDTVWAVFQSLWHRGVIDMSLGIHPIKSFRLPGLANRLLKGVSAESAALSADDKDKVQALIPPLLEMYLMAGAKIHGLPALDRDFSCVDFLTILETSKLSEPFLRRYHSE
ncbi:MAG: GNAT family N-acetyltransferase [Bdellovibrionales bacterium]|nr:GNAT family N-acetyltransferase [Bdellovibrionales bacterium]